MKRIIKMILYYGIIWGVTIIILFSIFGLIIEHYITSHDLARDSRYTITINMNSGRGRGSDEVYSFIVNKKKYFGWTTAGVNLRLNLEYFIQFYPKNPDINKFTSVIATQKDIDSLPPSGYKFLPHK